MSDVAAEALEDGRTAVAGLVWTVTPQGMGLAQARLTSRTAKAAGFLLRADGRNLALLPSPLAAAQCVALGDVLCQSLGPSWCGVFIIEDKPVFLAVNNTCILPDGDQVYSDERAARARLREEAGLYAKVCAPAAWGVKVTALDQSRSRSTARLSWARAVVVDKERPLNGSGPSP